MDQILELFKHLSDEQWLIDNGGFYIIMAIVFAETGLFIGFFLPGDYLLFVTGLLLNNNAEPFGDNHVSNLFYWATLITVAAILGNFVGYWFGRKSGEYLFKRKDTWYLKKKHLMQAHEFYEKKGGMAIVIARFVPIVRTFAPIIAGVVKMTFKKFAFYNVIGAIVWVFGLVLLGYWLGSYGWVKDHLEWIIIGIIVLTTGPVLFKMIFGKSISETAHIIPQDPEVEDLDDDVVGK